ncbi:phenylalanine--tRNA ligase subunit beta [Kiritimatiellaeota bacterium B1221]|nr:phenylalanine--tRNA ligase subunit beta [Kiritimatiellaeota bacterium B1221]
MLVPLSWLKELIDIPESIEELRDNLTYSGLEVEGIERHGSDFEGLVVAEIIAVDPHPNADKLTLCTVKLNDEERMQVVCGAPNVKVGLKTIYAPVGAVLPTGLKLKKAKIRGVESLGMLCAEDELGLSGDHRGIMELSPDLAPGTPAVEVLGGPEIVFDLEVTPNRPDCLSIIGVARELAALTGRSFRLPEVRFPDVPKNGISMQVDIRDAESCPRYTAQLLEGATVAPSPNWMQQRLRLCGLRPINNLVDITNYVMLETGQPLHAFDRSLIKGDCMIVRPAEAGEIMQTLDGGEQKLQAGDLVIADQERAVALAGIMGGANSEIQDSSSTILVESAAFSPSLVRGTAKRLNLHTDSSYRFARGSDMYAADWASQRASALICELAGAKPAGPLQDVWPGKTPLRTLQCKWHKICDLIGIDIPVSTMRGYFERLDLKILEEHPEGCTLEIPGFRSDLTRPVDLVEEIARLNGLDKIPVRPPHARIVPNVNDFEIRIRIRLMHNLASRGFLESLNYSLSSSEVLNDLDESNRDRQVILPNPISQDQSVLRTSLLPQMVETLAFNKAHQTEEVAFFEIGKTYLQREDGVEEHERVCLGTMGPWKRPLLDKQASVSDREAFTDLRGEVENVLHQLRCTDKVTFVANEDPAFAPGQSAELQCAGNVIGRIGLLSAKIKTRFKLSGPVALAEINLDMLIPERSLPPTMQPVPGFPSITRDVALILDRSKTHQMVLDLVNHQRPKDLVQVTLFDLFESDKLGENKKSMAYRFTYRNPKKTLTDKSVEKMHLRITQRLISELNATIVGQD